ncbi:MAG: hypothetical protein PUF12_13140 [Thermoflexaceae bacterium]|nr:hypothetical protein [Thermoflexaceae bacterium]
MKSESLLSKAIQWLVIIIVVYVIFGMFFPVKSGSRRDLADYTQMSVSEIEKALDVSLPLAEDMETKITQYSKSDVTVYGNGSLGVVCFDGQQGGLFSNSKRYSFFGINVGDTRIYAEENMTYEYDNSIIILNDYGFFLPTYFYYNEAKGDCFAITYDSQKVKVTAMTYYDSYAKITESTSRLY